MTVARFRNQRSYARSGLVHVVDEQTGEERSMNYRDFTKERIMHLMQMRDHPATPRYERAEYQKAINEALEVVFEAKRQGDPCAPMSESEANFARQRAKDIAMEKLNDINKIVTLDDMQKAQIMHMAEQGYAPTLLDEFGNPLHD